MNRKITCLQFDIAFGKPEENFTKALQLIREAAEDKPDIIVLPELWTTGYDLKRLDEIADEDGRETASFLAELARKHSVSIVGGSVAKRTGNEVRNTLLAVSPEDGIIHEYSKLHLFRLMNEDHYLAPGSEKSLFTLKGVKSAGLICYDIRFPEWIRTHTTRGAQVLFIVAEWPLARLEHWRTLLLARAIENQCFVVACNRSGSDPSNEFAGHSMIIDPWGEILAEAGKTEQSISASIQLDKVTEVRSQIPIFEDRRPSYYD
ncbi:carbon-nitrogen family hydrolase [Bacillus lacus]|uniref:Carbon-nitrogen family hydrolase n=1 Tax=Metabacillus lacus TaxID=1983721 RepID=A0A7X2M0V9_9BACI|nr:carbon-nitrogen family hydrolase [Metabacillus lacus]MRX73309.1 carbon-nitrogen family hydrolase [Metabacillus lacus]